MITILRKEDCCGCNACGDVCSESAISFERDIGGFLYPVVDRAKCLNCDACVRVCPIEHVGEMRKAKPDVKPITYAAVVRDLAVRFDSTSGGLFSVFANYVFANGGFVGGAVWDNEFYIHQIVTDDSSLLPQLRSSKYAQSDARGFYKSVQRALDKGRLVLVCGLPCQMLALRTYLGKDYPQLYILDLICRSCSSPSFLKGYFSYWEKKEGAHLVAVKQKDKGLGWRNLTTKLRFDNGHIVYDPKAESYFMRAFESNLISRPSCYECKFKGFPRFSDITLADCWGAVDKIPASFRIDQNIGTSLVMCNTVKGCQLFEKACTPETVRNCKVELSDVVAGNFGLVASIPRPAVRSPEIYAQLREKDLPDILDPIFDKLQSSTSGVCANIKNCLRYYWRIRRSFFGTLRLNGIGKIFCREPLLIPMGPVTFQRDEGTKVLVRSHTVLGASLFAHSRLESRCRMFSHSVMELNGGTIGHGCHIVIFDGGRLQIGRSVCANIGLTVSCAQHIKIGDNVFIGQNVTIRDTHGDHYINTPNYEPTRPVEIGDHVWICSNAMIMPGVKIGSGSIVAAHALVTKDVPPESMVAGIPARIIKTNVQFRC